MNDNKNIYNQNEVKNKLQNFQEGKDYFVTPSKKPEIKDYTFFNDRLKSLFGGNNWVPVRVWQEKYDDKNVSYRGHFEEGKDYKHSIQYWKWDPNYQGDRWEQDDPEWVKGIPWSEHSREWEYGEVMRNAFTGKKYWEKKWTYEGRGKANALGTSWEETKKIEPNQENELELKRRHEELMNKLSSYQKEPQCKDRDMKIEMTKKDIAELESMIEKEKNNPQYLLTCQCGRKFDKDKESWAVKSIRSGRDHWCSYDCAEKFKDNPNGKVEHCAPSWYDDGIQQKGRMGRNEKGDWATDNNPDLTQENHELRQELAAVQAELAKVLAELKKLTGKNEALGKLEQQQVYNEKVMKEGSVAEIKEQAVKSQALVQEVSNMNTTAPVKNEPKSSVLPYVVGGSLLVVGAGVVAIWLRKRSRK